MKRDLLLFTLLFIFSSICIAMNKTSAQDFATDILFTPNDEESQVQTLIFGGYSTSSDGYDDNDEMSPPPSQNYYAYFYIDDFPKFLRTDSKTWISPYHTNKTWTIVITNAFDITTTITWNPLALPAIIGGKFTLNGVSEGSVDMQSTGVATVEGNATLSLNYTYSEHTLTMSVNPAEGGTTIPSVGGHAYSAGETVTIMATSAAGYRFENWTGNVANPNNATTTVTMDDNKSVTAHFIRQYTLTMVVDPVGGGTTDPAVGNYKYDEGTVVTITATSNSGYQFVNWTGDVDNPNNATTTTTLNGDKTVIAHFEEVAGLTLTMEVNPVGGGTTTPSTGTHSYTSGTVVTITATPTTGYRFQNWSGDVADPNSPTTTVTMHSNKTVTANFLQQHTLTLTVTPVGSGTTNPVIGTHTYDTGTIVSITATPNDGYRFVNWIGDVANRFRQSTTIQLNGNKTVTANFVRWYTLTIQASPAGAGNTNPSVGDHFYDSGEVVGISAIPNTAYRFMNWTGDVADPNSPNTTVTIDSDKSITAHFIRQYTLSISVNESNWGTTVPPIGNHVYDLGAVVTVIATPKTTRYDFLNWEGDVTDPNSPTTTVTMNGNKNIKAYFYDTVPVELISFAATLIPQKSGGQEILLSWQTASETNNLGFEVERAFDLMPTTWESLNFVDGQGTSSSLHHYSLVDNTVSATGTYYYRLKQIDTNGSFEYSNTIHITVQHPLHFNLSQNFPNPFNPLTVIAFDLPQKSDVTLVLVNVLGDVVKVIDKGDYEAGHYEVVLNAWDLPTGVYFYRLEAGGFVDVKKLAVVK